MIGNLWGIPGAEDTITDRSATPESSVTTSGINKWYSFALTNLAQAWIGGALPNNGVLLRATPAWSTASFYLASCQDGAPSLRPKLTITYRLS